MCDMGRVGGIYVDKTACAKSLTSCGAGVGSVDM